MASPEEITPDQATDDEPPEEWDISDEGGWSSRRGLAQGQSSRPPVKDVRMVAVRLLWIFSGVLVLALSLTTWVAFQRPDQLQDVIAFFGTVIATVSTLVAGVVAFYFANKK